MRGSSGDSAADGRGFTLVEIILVVAAISILAGVVIVAINPARQMAESRNSVRRADVGVIWSAVHQYALDHNGELPSAIPQGDIFSDCLDSPTSQAFGICRTDSCEVVLSELLEDSRYLIEIPVDPSAGTEEYSGYSIVKDVDHNGRIVVCAPGAENGETIYFSR